MARPTRQGVDYFPLDIHLDDKFKFIEIKFKLEGFATIIKLMQKIYSYGYWYNWEEDEELIFAHENNIKEELLREIIEESLKRDIFSLEMYNKYKILTSSGIQKRYKEIVKRRKDVEIVVEYLLVDNNFGVNDSNVSPLSEQNVSIMSTSSIQDDIISTQSKVNRKESRVKESNGIDDQDKYLKILQNIEGYPYDESIDINYYLTLIERYPTLDIIKAIQSFSDYKLGKPFKDNSNHKLQISNWCKNDVEIYKKNLKPVEELKYIDENPFNTNRG